MHDETLLFCYLFTIYSNKIKSIKEMNLTELLSWLLSHRLHMFLKGRCDKSHQCAMRSTDCMTLLNRFMFNLVYVAIGEKLESIVYNFETASRGLGKFLGTLFDGAIVLTYKIGTELVLDTNNYNNKSKIG